jgi:hypothetical protein
MFNLFSRFISRSLDMRNRSVENALGLLGAAGLGVGLMYMLDPEHGRERRERLASTAEHALSNTGEMLGSTLHGASHSAGTVAKKISGYAQHLAEHLSDTAHEAAENGEKAAHGFVSQARQKVHEAHQELADRASALWSRAKRSGGMERESHPVAMATGITAATVGVLGLGAGLMYVLDPSRGRARRAWMRDKIVSVTRQTGREARRYGRHLSNRMTGYAHRAQRANPWQDEQASMPSAGNAQ